MVGARRRDDRRKDTRRDTPPTRRLIIRPVVRLPRELSESISGPYCPAGLAFVREDRIRCENSHDAETQLDGPFGGGKSLEVLPNSYARPTEH